MGIAACCRGMPLRLNCVVAITRLRSFYHCLHCCSCLNAAAGMFAATSLLLMLLPAQQPLQLHPLPLHHPNCELLLSLDHNNLRGSSARTSPGTACNCQSNAQTGQRLAAIPLRTTSRATASLQPTSPCHVISTLSPRHLPLRHKCPVCQPQPTCPTA